MAATQTKLRESPPVVEDHRVRVGRDRRNRMRAHLMESVMAVYPTGRSGGPAVIDDVIRHANVSRGTFYKYFDSLDQAVTEMGIKLTLEMTEQVMPVYATLENPVMRNATGFQTFLLRALTDHKWGAFLAHIGLLSSDNIMVQKITADIQMGIATGDYSVPSPEVAVDLMMGAKIEAIQRIISGGGDIAYIHAMTSMVLRSMGVTARRADKVVLEASNRLCAAGPALIPWWKVAE